jgi:hypothetical protein
LAGQTKYFWYNLGMPYYHGTHVWKLPSIQRFGLGGALVEKNYPDCDNGVYLSLEPDYCLYFLIEHYIETGDKNSNPSERLKEFRVILIDDARVNKAKLEPDPHLDGIPGVFLYKGVIDITAMPILDVDQLRTTYEESVTP